MTIGKAIEAMIDINCQIWHEVTKIKDLDGKLHNEPTMPTEERVDCALKIRKLNAERSKIRWDIDKHFGGANETKVFSGGE
jgi:hypothetical protein